MNKGLLYPKLAIINIRKNLKTYLPYMLTSIVIILMFYNICALTYHASTGRMLKPFMVIGMIVTAIFSVVFLFYTNSFLIKRRKKEFGLYNVLGMEKRHIGLMMFYENIFVSGTNLIFGLGFGILLNKLVTLMLYKLLKFDPKYDFNISPEAVTVTLVIFISIFFLVLLNDLRLVGKANPIELLKGSELGEKEPKTKFLTALTGFLTLGAGYYLAVTIESPINAIFMFFVAVVLVMIGTYCLFTAGSIAILKLLKRNKRYFYKIRHFTSVSGMIYRMKQNAVGLANICLMSTAVLVMISTTLTLYISMEEHLNAQFPLDAAVEARYYPNNEGEEFDKDLFRDTVIDIAQKNGIIMSKMTEYEAMVFFCGHDAQGRYTERYEYMVDTDEISGTILFRAIEISDYNRITGSNKTLSGNDVLVYSIYGNVNQKFILYGREYNVVEYIDRFDVYDDYIGYLLYSNFWLVVPDGMLETLQQDRYDDCGGIDPIYYCILFDIDDGEENISSFEYDFYEYDFHHTEFSYKAISFKKNTSADLYEMYGGLLFLGIFLGGLFLLATSLIIYYKQLVEGYDDKRRFEIMQKVGMSHKEVRKSINSQVLTVFFIPIAVAAVHICFAFGILQKLLSLFGFTKVSLFIICTVASLLVFFLIYTIVYMLTARVYNKIVRA